MANSRYQARKVACQDNLRVLGEGLLNYSMRDPGQRFPLVPISGSRSFAGVFAPILFEYEMIGPDGSRVICPGSELALNWPSMIPAGPCRRCRKSTGPRIRLQQLQDRAGGSYAYSVGYIEDGRLQAVRNLNRSNFALLSDAPSFTCRIAAVPITGAEARTSISRTATTPSSRTCESLPAAMIRGATVMVSRKPARIGSIPWCSPVACDRSRTPSDG